MKNHSASAWLRQKESPIVHASPQGSVADLVRDYHKAVYHYAYRLTGCVQDAEDLTQQVFLLAQKGLCQLRNRTAARSWLFSILRNCHLKDRQRQRPALASDIGVDISGLCSESKTNWNSDELQAALQRLPQKSRLLLAMFYFDDCSYREIAKMLNVPLGTVMSRLARARTRLRAILLQAEPRLA